MLPVLRRHAQPSPRRATVAADLSCRRPLLEQHERRAQPYGERVAVHAEQLLFRVVYVVEVDRLDAQVLPAARELVREELRRDAVAATHELLARDEPGGEQLALEPRIVRLP